LFPNPTTIISGAENGELMLWDIPSGERRRTLAGHNDRVISLKVHNNLLASGSSDGTVRIWDIGSTNTECMHVLDGHSGYVDLLGFSPNGSLLATGAGGGETKIWDVNSGSCRATCVGHTKVATQFFNHANDQLISSSADGTIRTWEWATGTLIDTFQTWENADANNALRGFAWYKNYLISGAMNGLFRAWDWQNRQSHVDLRTEAAQSVYHLVSQGDLIAIAVNAGGGKHLIEVWNVSALDLDGEIRRAARSRLSLGATS
jgi:WD40 repeat protein